MTVSCVGLAILVTVNAAFRWDYFGRGIVREHISFTGYDPASVDGLEPVGPTL